MVNNLFQDNDLIRVRVTAFVQHRIPNRLERPWNTNLMKLWKNPLGRVLRLRHHQLLPKSFLRRDVKNRAQSLLVFRSCPSWNLAHQAGIHERVFPAPPLQQPRKWTNIFKGLKYVPRCTLHRSDWGGPSEGKKASCTSDYCTGTSLESQRKVEGTATSKSTFTTVICQWISDRHSFNNSILTHHFRNTTLSLNSRKVMSWHTRPMGQHNLQADPSIHLLIS